MINEDNASVDLMADIVHIAQRTSPETCDIAARTIARQALNFVKSFPESINNVQDFQYFTRELCECLLSLKKETSGTGEEIMIKRNALDILLMISAALVFPNIDVDDVPVETTPDTAQYA